MTDIKIKASTIAVKLSTMERVLKAAPQLSFKDKLRMANALYKREYKPALSHMRGVQRTKLNYPL